MNKLLLKMISLSILSGGGGSLQDYNLSVVQSALHTYVAIRAFQRYIAIRLPHMPTKPSVRRPMCFGGSKCFTYIRRRDDLEKHFQQFEHVVPCKELRQYYGTSGRLVALRMPGEWCVLGSSSQSLHVTLVKPFRGQRILTTRQWWMNIDKCVMRILPIRSRPDMWRVVFESRPGVSLPSQLSSRTAGEWVGFHVTLQRQKRH